MRGLLPPASRPASCWALAGGTRSCRTPLARARRSSDTAWPTPRGMLAQRRGRQSQAALVHAREYRCLHHAPSLASPGRQHPQLLPKLHGHSPARGGGEVAATRLTPPARRRPSKLPFSGHFLPGSTEAGENPRPSRGCFSNSLCMPLSSHPLPASPRLASAPSSLAHSPAL